MQREPLTFSHRDLLQPLLKGAAAGLSEYSFPNLWLFRQRHGYEVGSAGGDTFIIGRTYDGTGYLMPTRGPRTGDPELLALLLSDLSGIDCLFPIPEAWLAPFAAAGWNSSSLEGDSDYLYTLEKIATYKGRHLHKKRNLVKQFLELHIPVPLPLTPDRVPEALRVLDLWQADMGVPAEQTDHAAAREALLRMDDLQVCGGIYLVDGEPGGYILGEEVAPDMFALHFAKGLRKFKGLYQYMYQTFANVLPRSYAWLNFEQDLGLLALKIAKSSYEPDRMALKFRLQPPAE